MLCSFKDCVNDSRYTDNPRYKKKSGLCWAHYKRKRKHGDPELGGHHHRSLLGSVMKRSLEEIKKAYWAGFFDGEGSLGIYCSKRGVSYRATISQIVSGSSVLYEIASVYDAGIGEYYSALRPVVTLQLSGLRAYEFLHDVFPYLTVKKEQAKIFLAHIEELRSKGYDHEATEIVSAKLKELKRK